MPSKAHIMAFLGGVLVTVVGLYAYDKLKSTGVLK